MDADYLNSMLFRERKVFDKTYPGVRDLKKRLCSVVDEFIASRPGDENSVAFAKALRDDIEKCFDVREQVFEDTCIGDISDGFRRDGSTSTEKDDGNGKSGSSLLKKG